MKIFAISDLHLSSAVEKPMDIFGAGWENHFEKICEDWRAKVAQDDLVLLGGDMSWGMSMPQAAPDYALVSALPGIKLVGKGNHDYYWTSLEKMRQSFQGFMFLQNNAYRVLKDGTSYSYASAARKKDRRLPEGEQSENAVVICGSRGWNIPNKDSSEQDVKIYERELDRLKLSLDSASQLRNEGDVLIALLHYPPFDADLAPTEVTKLLGSYGVQYVVYGHLHGKNVRTVPRLTRGNTEYILTSCDLVDNKLQYICEVGTD